MFKQYLAVMIGGAIGAVGRYGVSVWVPADPWKVLLINWVGCFVLGFFTAFAVRTGRVSDVVRVGVGTGVLGGFTTFSTFSLDAVKLMEQDLWLDVALYVVGSLVGGVALAWVGTMLGRRGRVQEVNS
ncbi:fluoride efflux transporter CrcB [Tumebacillus permanentifrigoris]|uniref:fluoride efflux transporter CrcB n=1 Tax=Tumebacillus permanentifrigoris TaxID=378543 RepID=UPI001FE7DB96|nr:fluoride efflux transporter CrcB [Tumebacillus permanentifrigoris]